jgi:hypothetical protein
MRSASAETDAQKLRKSRFLPGLKQARTRLQDSVTALYTENEKNKALESGQKVNPANSSAYPSALKHMPGQVRQSSARTCSYYCATGALENSRSNVQFKPCTSHSRDARATIFSPSPSPFFRIFKDEVYIVVEALDIWEVRGRDLGDMGVGVQVTLARRKLL